jgi:S-adenosylmethionine hydrolase
MIITLTTDFGLSDPFVGIMKGVILGVAPDAQLVDITHDIRSYDVLEAAFMIETAYRYFPEKTVHLVIVDPGVGSARRPIAATVNGHTFVAPDNGVLSYVLERSTAVYEITNRDLFLTTVSQTFHGRDIFAPVAAHLALGNPIHSVGPSISNAIQEPLPEPSIHKDRVRGVVLRIDKYGNIITNLRREHLRSNFRIRIAGVVVTRLCSSFSEARTGELLAIDGSTGWIELAINQGSAAERLKVERGAEIEVESTSANQ